jgi:hypothetical protein
MDGVVEFRNGHAMEERMCMIIRKAADTALLVLVNAVIAAV